MPLRTRWNLKKMGRHSFWNICLYGGGNERIFFFRKTYHCHWSSFYLFLAREKECGGGGAVSPHTISRKFSRRLFLFPHSHLSPRFQVRAMSRQRESHSKRFFSFKNSWNVGQDEAAAIFFFFSKWKRLPPPKKKFKCLINDESDLCVFLKTKYLDTHRQPIVASFILKLDIHF